MMNKISCILKAQFGIECSSFTEIHGGLSAMNYKVMADEKAFFLKVYHKKKAQTSLWTENIDCYMPLLVWLNENTELRGRIVRPIKTKQGDYRLDDDENVILLFDYIQGEPVGKSMTRAQVLEAAEIMACLHRYGSELPAHTQDIEEDFSVSFCFSLEKFISENSAMPDDVKAILQPCLELLNIKNCELKQLSGKVKQKNVNKVLCHTDAHGYNLMQSEHLVLVDWEGIKLAPAEADLVLFTKKEYWDGFIGHYRKLQPDFILDDELLLFYILRRKVEDIWAFIESLLFDQISDEQRKCDLGFLSKCCNTLDDLWFEL